MTIHNRKELPANPRVALLFLALARLVERTGRTRPDAQMSLWGGAR